MGMIGIILFLVVLVGAILYVRLRHGCFFEPRFGVNFPEELKSYMRKNLMKYGAWGIAPFLRRFNKAKEREGTLFSSERFLDGEKEKLMRMKKNRR